MITTREDLKDFLRYEKKLYISDDKKNRMLQIITCMPDYALWKYVKLLRITEFHYNNRKGTNIKTIWHSIMYLIDRKRKNSKGLKLGIEIWENSIDKGLRIYHSGNIVINGMAHIGKDCQLHGSNCIGNDGITFDAPVIGDNVEIGVGAKIIGGIEIGNDAIIGAGSVVVKSFPEQGCVLCGVPAVLKRKNVGYF